MNHQRSTVHSYLHWFLETAMIRFSFATTETMAPSSDLTKGTGKRQKPNYKDFSTVKLVSAISMSVVILACLYNFLFLWFRKWPFLSTGMSFKCLCQRSDKFLGSGDSTKDTSLLLNHRNGCVMILWIGRSTTICEQDAFISHIVGMAHSSMNTDIRCHTRKDNILNALCL